MARLRHIALAVSDLAASARFYEESFGLERLRESDAAVVLTDGAINITLLHLPTNRIATPDHRGRGFVGVHHFGFEVDDLDAASGIIARNGGVPHGEDRGGSERKFRDPDGQPFDIANDAHVRAVWRLSDPAQHFASLPEPGTAGRGRVTAAKRARG